MHDRLQKGGTPASILFYKKFMLFLFFYFFSGEVLLFQTKILILEVFLNFSNYYIYNDLSFFLKH